MRTKVGLFRLAIDRNTPNQRLSQCQMFLLAAALPSRMSLASLSGEMLSNILCNDQARHLNSLGITAGLIYAEEKSSFLTPLPAD